jgi:alkylhydroperoxidase family enzyme
MAYITLIEESQAEGELKSLYDEAVRRAGKVFNIVKCMSLAPHHLRASIELYLAIMHGESPLTRKQREMLAVVVSRANGCHY